MLDAALQPSTCASPARRDNLVRGVDGKSTRTTIAELRCARVRDVDAACFGQRGGNQLPPNKTLATPQGLKEAGAMVYYPTEIASKRKCMDLNMKYLVQR